MLYVLLSIVKACDNLLFCCSFSIKHYALVLVLYFYDFENWLPLIAEVET